MQIYFCAANLRINPETTKCFGIYFKDYHNFFVITITLPQPYDHCGYTTPS